MGNLGDMVSELEQDYESLRQECRQLEEQLDDLEGQLELANDDLEKFKEFHQWVLDTFPEVVNAYGCISDIKEKSND